jgi:hypothetical protein
VNPLPEGQRRPIPAPRRTPRRTRPNGIAAAPTKADCPGWPGSRWPFSRHGRIAGRCFSRIVASSKGAPTARTALWQAPPGKGITIKIISATAHQDRYEHAVLARDAAARELFETELALHDAHQTHVDSWITAASDHLHLAVVRHAQAVTAVAALVRLDPEA